MKNQERSMLYFIELELQNIYKNSRAIILSHYNSKYYYFIKIQIILLRSIIFKHIRIGCQMDLEKEALRLIKIQAKQDESINIIRRIYINQITPEIKQYLETKRRLSALVLTQCNLISFKNFPDIGLLCIDLSCNKLSDDCNIEILLQYKSLKQLFLTENNITKIQTILKLKPLRHIIELDFEDNPVQYIDDYRQVLFKEFKRLKSLDHVDEEGYLLDPSSNQKKNDQNQESEKNKKDVTKMTKIANMAKIKKKKKLCQVFFESDYSNDEEVEEEDLESDQDDESNEEVEGEDSESNQDDEEVQEDQDQGDQECQVNQIHKVSEVNEIHEGDSEQQVLEPLPKKRTKKQ